MASAHAAKETCPDGAEVCPCFQSALEVLPSLEAPAADVEPAASISTNQYYSARTQWMIENRNKFSSQVEFEIECSKVHHTCVHEGEDSGGEEDIDEEEDERELDEEILQANRNTINELKEHPVWRSRVLDDDGSSRDGTYEVSEKIGKGGEATIYAGVSIDAMSCRKHVVMKVYRRGHYLRDLVKQWPETPKWPHGCRWFVMATNVEHVMLMPNDGRIAMVMKREWGDLRRLIDLKKEANHNQGPPFDLINIVRVMDAIATGMWSLHSQDAVHRDLKASNVLVDSSKIHRRAWESNVAAIELPLLDKPGSIVKVSDYECALGVMGTGFWRAPEVLLGIRDPIKKCSPTSLFTMASDVYSYGMVCYEIATGFFPFEREGFIGTKAEQDRVISGERPSFPDDVDCRVKDLIMRCWQQDESARPTFEDICGEVSSIGSDERIPLNHPGEYNTGAQVRRNDGLGSKARFVVAMMFLPGGTVLVRYQVGISEKILLKFRIRQIRSFSEDFDIILKNTIAIGLSFKGHFEETYRLREKKIGKGDWVLVFDNTLEHQYSTVQKFAKRWIGPYVVIKVYFNDTYSLRELYGVSLREPVAGKRIKLFQRSGRFHLEDLEEIF